MASSDGAFVVGTVELAPRLRINFAGNTYEYEADGLKLDGLPAMALPCAVIDTYDETIDAIKGFTMADIPAIQLTMVGLRRWIMPVSAFTCLHFRPSILEELS